MERVALEILLDEREHAAGDEARREIADEDLGLRVGQVRHHHRREDQLEALVAEGEALGLEHVPRGDLQSSATLRPGDREHSLALVGDEHARLGAGGDDPAGEGSGPGADLEDSRARPAREQRLDERGEHLGGRGLSGARFHPLGGGARLSAEIEVLVVRQSAKLHGPELIARGRVR